MVNKVIQRGVCHFQNDWLDPKVCPDFLGWVVKHDNTHTRCKFCTTVLDVSKLGWLALVSHTIRKRHKDRAQSNSQNMTSFFKVPVKPACSDEINNNESFESLSSQSKSASASMIPKNNMNV